MPIPRKPDVAALLGALLSLSACLMPPAAGNVETLALDQTEALASANAFRAENDLPALSVDARLMAAARTQAETMAGQGVLDHDVGGKLPRRLAAAGYDWQAAAENIGRGYADYGAAMKGWIGSPRHRRNLLDPNVREIGFAGARSGRDGRNYWAQVFGAERARPAAVPPPLGGVTTSRGATLRFP